MPRFAVILPAAGQSRRFAYKRRKKPFAELHGRAVWLRSLDLFDRREDVVQIFLCLAPEDIDWFRRTFQADLAFHRLDIIPGGAERADSVGNALAQVRDEADYVAVHDAARPLLVDAWIDEIFAAAAKSGAAIPAVPTTSTLKRTREGRIVETVPRDDLWQAQTPQVFRTELLREAFARRGDLVATDEAQLVEQLGHPVEIVPGSPMNFKITTYDDFRMAEALLDALPRKRGLEALRPESAKKPEGNLFDRLGG